MIDHKTAPYAILALRVTTGALFLFHGLVKVFVFTPAGTVGFFESIGLPGALTAAPRAGAATAATRTARPRRTAPCRSPD